MYEICYEMARRVNLWKIEMQVLTARWVGLKTISGVLMGKFRACNGIGGARRDFFRYSVDHYFCDKHTGRHRRLVGALGHHFNATKDGTLHLTLCGM
jgi:hypothetical protein